MASGEGFKALLIADLRTLSSEARRSDSLAGQLTGWLSGPEYPAIKDAAERTLLKLLSQEDENVIDKKEALKPYLMACESKSAKLASISLVSLQRMLAHDMLGSDELLIAIQALEQVERMNDEGVKLKMLQTALTLMQSHELAQNEEGVAAVLGVCFRLLADPKNSDSVVSTAMATVRQAVALVFEHVGTSSTEVGGGADQARLDAGEDVLAAKRAGFARQGSALLAQHGAANAALKLLDDLCMMVTANEAMLKWLRAPSLPRTFVLDLLDFVLANSAPVFKNIAAFEHALLVRICQLLITALQNLLDPGCERLLQETDLRVVLRVVRTVVWHFHRQLRSKCGVFIETMLGGTQINCTLWQRINVMVVLRQLVSNPHIIHFLFTTYDLKQDSKLNAVTDMARTFTGIVEGTLRLAAEIHSDEPIQTVAALYQQKAHAGKDWLMDIDYGTVGPELGSAYLTMLAIDSLLSLIAALEVLTDARTDEKGHVSESPPPDPLTCAGLVEASWRHVLPVLSQLLASCHTEALVLNLLKGYSSFTQACGELEMVEPRDAFLSSLCQFTLTSADSNDAEHTSPSGDSATGPSGRVELKRHNSLAGSGGAGVDGPEPIVLSPKNVQALRTLFNIAHRLDHHLGRSWLLVLENLNTLDKILHSPRTTTQEISAQSSSAALPSDLSILATAANQLFESTAAMSTKACVSLLLALRDVSTKSLPAASQMPGNPKLFALSRMVEVLLYNLHRLHDLWPIFLEHVVEVLSDPKASIRSAALEALGKAIGGALASVTASRPYRSTSLRANGDAKDEERAVRDGAAEHMLLGALVELYADAKETDVRLGLLRLALQFLQRHGEQLSTGWEVMLRLLEAVPKGEEAATVSLAFQSMQLLASDFMSSLPADLLRKAVEVAALYASQQADMNVSLTAISLLWNAADLLAKRSVHEEGQQSSAEASGALGNGDATAAAGTLDSDQFEELLRILFRALQNISTDGRSEVRNCGVRTLFLVVVSQGARLSGPAWDEVLWQMVFPLLRSVHHMAATSSREENQAEILGKVKGKSVAMVMHHSRNSQQKMWDETLVLALAGMGRLLRAHFAILVAMPAFPQGWEELMLVLESSLAGGRREVALAALGVLVSMMQTHGSSSLLQRPMWKRALRAMGVGVEAAASPQCMVPLQARLELVAAIGHVHAALKDVLEGDDLHSMFGWLEGLVKNPFSDDDTAAVMPGTLPPVQKAALQVYPSLAPLQHETLWGDYLGSLLRLLRPHLLESAPYQQPPLEPGQRPAAKDLKRWATSSLSMETTILLLADIFREVVPWQERAAHMAALVTGLADCMATRFTAFSENLWRVAVGAFNAMVAVGLPAVNIAYVHDGDTPPPEVWSALAQAFEWFLLGDHLEVEANGTSEHGTPRLSETGSFTSRVSLDKVDIPELLAQQSLSKGTNGQDTGSPEQSRSDADLEASVLDTLTDTVLTACTWAPGEVQQRLVAVLDRGVARARYRNMPGSAVGARFPQLCLRKLYVVCSRGREPDGAQSCLHEVAKVALPLLVKRADGMLRAHAVAIAVGKARGGRLRMDDLLCMLEVLQALSLSPSVVDAAWPPGSPVQELVAVRRRQLGAKSGGREKAHLLLLYPALCACITSPEPQMREILQDILLQAGVELGLAEPTATDDFAT